MFLGFKTTNKQCWFQWPQGLVHSSCEVLTGNIENEHSHCLCGASKDYKRTRNIQNRHSGTLYGNNALNWFTSLPSLELDTNRMNQNWLSQHQNHVTKRDIGSRCGWPDLPVGLPYKVTMSVHFLKLKFILLWNPILPGHKSPTNKYQTVVSKNHWH